MTLRMGTALVAGFASLFASATLGAAPAGGGSSTQNVNVVNTPTVNIGSGGPIGVDVLTMPSQAIAVSVPAPKAVAATITVPAGYDQPEPFVYTPSAGKRAVIRSLLLTVTAEPDCLTQAKITYTGGYQYLRWQSVLQYPDLNLALPPGPVSVSFTKYFGALGCSPAPAAFPAYLLMTIDEVPAG